MHVDRQYIQTTRNPDDTWVGTIAGEDQLFEPCDDLYALAGIDPEQWSILAIDLYWLKTGNQAVDVYAVDKLAAHAPEHDDLRRLGRGDGLPLARISLQGVGATQVIERCMRNTRVNLRATAFEKDKMYIVDHIEHPAD